MKYELKIGDLRVVCRDVEQMLGRTLVAYALFPFLGRTGFHNGWTWKVCLN